MKKFLVALLVLLLSVSIFAGGAKEEEKGKSITYVTLGDTGLSNGYLQKAAEAFKEKTGVEVVFESWSYSDAYQKILTLAESGNFPDAMYGFSSWTELFMEAGWTVPINEYVSQEFIDDFSQAAIDVCSVDGNLWALPSYMSVRSVLINKNSLDAAGAEVPETWEEFLAIAPKLQNEVTPYAYTLVAGHPKNTLDCYLPFLWAYGGDVLSPDRKTVAFNTPEGVASLQMYVDIAKYAEPGYGENTINETQAAFTNQTAAAYIHNGQGLAALQAAGEDYSWAEILPPLKGPDGDAYSYGVMDVDLLFKTGNEEIAAQWLEFWHQAQYMGQVTKELGFVPNQKSIIEAIPDFTDPENALVAPFVEFEGMAKFKPSIICWEEIQKIMADHITNAVFGRETPAEAWAAAEKECNEVIAAQ